MPLNIRRHSLLVTEVALFLGRQLNRNSLRLDLAVVEAGALLHDIGKMQGIRTGENHALLGAKMLSERVDPAVSRIVGEHIYLEAPLIAGPITESLLVNYSDKRVKHDTVVSVEERYHDLIARYSKTESHRLMLMEKLQLYIQLEAKIFSHLNIEPMGAEVMGLTIAHLAGPETEDYAAQKNDRCVACGREVR